MQVLNFYHVDLKYVRNLSKLDDHVMSISPQIGKEKRPFLGIITLVNGRKYCIPITSPKEKFRHKKSQVDFIKIFDKSEKDINGNYKLIGILNINNMIPIKDGLVTKIDISVHKNDTFERKRYKILMHKQLDWCRANFNIIQNRANKVYKAVTEEPNQNINLYKRCLKFKQLERILDKS